MADASNLGNVTLTVGQQAEFVLNFQGSAPTSVWIACANPSVIEPVLADGTPLTWPQEVMLTNGVGTYFLFGVGVGVTDYYFRNASDPNNTTNLATASITVTPPLPPGQTPGDETVIEVMSIGEPILITIIVQQPGNTSSD